MLMRRSSATQKPTSSGNSPGRSLGHRYLYRILSHDLVVASEIAGFCRAVLDMITDEGKKSEVEDSLVEMQVQGQLG
jgi:hypothetical protein